MNMDPTSAAAMVAASAAHRARKSVPLGCCKGERTDKMITKLGKQIVDISAIAGYYAVADVSGALVIAFCPYMMYQKRLLTELGGFRNLLNQMRMKVNEFMIQNNHLSRNVTKLSVSIDELEVAEQELQKLVGTGNVDRLVHIVKETKQVQDEMKKNILASIIQDMITTIIRTDKDGDMLMSPNEMKYLIMRLDKNPSFEFRKDLFLQIVGDSNEPVPVNNIIKVIHNIKDRNLPQEKRIFVINEGQLNA